MSALDSEGFPIVRLAGLEHEAAAAPKTPPRGKNLLFVADNKRTECVDLDRLDDLVEAAQTRACEALDAAEAVAAFARRPLAEAHGSVTLTACDAAQLIALLDLVEQRATAAVSATSDIAAERLRGAL